MNPFGIYFDEDKRRVYEVPVDSSFVVDADGYRIYTPDDLSTASVSTSITTTYYWSEWVDFHNEHLWSTLALSKSGGAYRFTDASGAENFANFDLRHTNQWQFVLADYPHQFLMDGNLYADQTLGVTFDSERITSQGVIPTINFADAVQVVNTGSAASIDAEALGEAIWGLLESAHSEPGSMGAALKETREHAEECADGSGTVSTGTSASIEIVVR